MEEFKVEQIIGAGVCAAVILWNAAALTISRVRAGKAGILRVKYPTTAAGFFGALLLSLTMWGSFVYFAVDYRQAEKHLDDMKTRGMIAVAEYENKTVDELLSGAEFIGDESYEEIYLERETASFTSVAEQKRIIMFAAAIGAFTVTLLMLSGCGAYITKSGVMFFTGIKPLKTRAKIQGNKICFYTSKRPAKAAFKLPATKKNWELFSDFIAPVSAETTAEDKI